MDFDFAGIMSWAGLSPWKWESHGRIWDAIQGLSTEGGGGVQDGPTGPPPGAVTVLAQLSAGAGF